MLKLMLAPLAILFVSAKLMALRLPFYGAALLAVLSLRFLDHPQRAGFITAKVLIELGIALVLFFLLDKSEGKLFAWLFWFAATFVALTLVL